MTLLKENKFPEEHRQRIMDNLNQYQVEIQKRQQQMAEVQAKNEEFNAELAEKREARLAEEKAERAEARKKADAKRAKQKKDRQRRAKKKQKA